MPRKILIALPPLLLEKVDAMARNEHRTRSDLIRESLRQYDDRYQAKQAALANAWHNAADHAVALDASR